MTCVITPCNPVNKYVWVFNLKTLGNSGQSTLLNYRKINNSSFTGLLDTHINTSAHEEMAPNPANTQTQQTLPIYTTLPPQPRSATHHRHPITNKLIGGPPPTHTDPSTSNGHPHQSSIFNIPNLKPQTSPASPIITAKPETRTQGNIALNVPTPSLLEEITPQCAESNARFRKRTAHGNRSRNELPQTQHSLAATVEGPPLLQQTETPRSQRVSNQTIKTTTQKAHCQYHCHKLQLLLASLTLHPLTNLPPSLKTNQQSAHGRQKLPPQVERGHAAKQKVSIIRH